MIIIHNYPRVISFIHSHCSIVCPYVYIHIVLYSSRQPIDRSLTTFCSLLHWMTNVLFARFFPLSLVCLCTSICRRPVAVERTHRPYTVVLSLLLVSSSSRSLKSSSLSTFFHFLFFSPSLSLLFLGLITCIGRIRDWKLDEISQWKSSLTLVRTKSSYLVVLLVICSSISWFNWP